MKIKTTLALCVLALSLSAQTAVLRGVLQNPESEPLAFANVALFNAADSSLAKAGASDETGRFELKGLPAGAYFLKAVYLGFNELQKYDIQLDNTRPLDLGTLVFTPAAISLSEATVTATRALVEIKPDRTVFNVDGTINSAGADGLSLLRKAPAVTVDNNDNISVLGRSGVLIYLDGKRLPLSGQDLSNYLQSLPAEQIDRIDIITNPGAKYEAEGNAGIIDIRLKKDKSLGANGTANLSSNQGRFNRTNLGASGNYRNKHVNVFGSAGLGNNNGFMDMAFHSYLNGMVQDEINNNRNHFENYDFRAGADFFLSKKHTIGLLATGNTVTGTRSSYNRITLAQQSAPDHIDSILVANATADYRRRQQTYNLNYRFDNGQSRTLNLDLDYGNFNNDTRRLLPNRYYDASEQVLLTEIVNTFNTPTDIDIYTFKADFEDKLWGGTLGLGTKLSRVVSDNTFLYYDVEGNVEMQNNRYSNKFKYDEKVYAGYLNYARPITKNLNFSAGLRAEQTDAMGDLQAFLPELQEPPVNLNYLSWFPNAGLSWQLSERHTLAFNYGRRINRPDYNVLNPFNSPISQLSYEKGNPFLRPEIVNNLELGYTLAQRYNVKLAYSRTIDQITRLIAPDENDPRAGFISWANLASQTVYSLNISAPVQILKKWNAYFNASASHQNNQADYGNGATVDVQAFSYSIYQQHTFDLPLGITGEISGYYSGPGIWGGVFKYKTSWGLDIGLQRKFLDGRLNVKLSGNDLFYETGWEGYSDFGGLYSYGHGNWDSRRISLSMSYRFGNDNVKSRRRQTGLEDETGRLGG